MPRYLVLMLATIGVVACGAEPTPTPDLVATQVAVEMAAHATMTARAPTVTDTPAPTIMPTDTPPPTDTREPTDTPGPTKTPAPTDTPRPSPTPTPTPVLMVGAGSGSTESMTPPWPAFVVDLRGLDSDMYIFTPFVTQGGKELRLWQMSEILFAGVSPEPVQRLVLGNDPIRLEVETSDSQSSRWEISLRPLGISRTMDFLGRGKAVSGLFAVPSDQPMLFQITHDEIFNFTVKLHCVGGTQTAFSAAHPNGRVSTLSTIIFPEGPCLWEVLASGSWSILAQQ